MRRTWSGSPGDPGAELVRERVRLLLVFASDTDAGKQGVSDPWDDAGVGLSLQEGGRSRPGTSPAQDVGRHRTPPCSTLDRSWWSARIVNALKHKAAPVPPARRARGCRQNAGIRVAQGDDTPLSPHPGPHPGEQARFDRQGASHKCPLRSATTSQVRPQVRLLRVLHGSPEGGKYSVQLTVLVRSVPLQFAHHASAFPPSEKATLAPTHSSCLSPPRARSHRPLVRCCNAATGHPHASSDRSGCGAYAVGVRHRRGLGLRQEQQR